MRLTSRMHWTAGSRRLLVKTAMPGPPPVMRTVSRDRQGRTAAPHAVAAVPLAASSSYCCKEGIRIKARLA